MKQHFGCSIDCLGVGVLPLIKDRKYSTRVRDHIQQRFNYLADAMRDFGWLGN